MQGRPRALRLRPSEVSADGIAREASRLLRIAQRVGKRLLYRANQLGEGELPDQDFEATFKYYAKVVTVLLAEQRARVIAAGGGALSDEELNTELDELVAKRLQQLTPAERRALLAGELEPAVDLNGRPILEVHS